MFFISPLVKGLEPWQYNIGTMNGSYCEDIVDGIRYRIIQCDDIEIFADRGVYLSVLGGDFTTATLTISMRRAEKSLRIRSITESTCSLTFL